MEGARGESPRCFDPATKTWCASGSLPRFPRMLEVVNLMGLLGQYSNYLHFLGRCDQALFTCTQWELVVSNVQHNPTRSQLPRRSAQILPRNPNLQRLGLFIECWSRLTSAIKAAARQIPVKDGREKLRRFQREGFALSSQLLLPRDKSDGTCQPKARAQRQEILLQRPVKTRCGDRGGGPPLPWV